MSRLLPACLVMTVALPAGAAPRLKDEPPPVYHPMTIGDKWVTVTETTTAAGATTQEVTEVVTAVEKKDDGVLVTVGREVDGKVQPAQSQLKVTDKGLFRVATAGTTYDAPYLVLKLPLMAGDAWTAESRAGGAAGSTFKYKAAKEEEVEVPAGKYKAFRLEVEVEGPGQAGRASIWYAPRVGVVRLEQELGGVKTVRQLKSFTPKK